MYAPVTKQQASVNLSLPTLETLVGEFERVFSLKEAVTVYDMNRRLLYGPTNIEREPDTSQTVEVYGVPFVTLHLYTDEVDSVAQRALSFLATSLAQVAMETRRRDQMADEVLARYDELNLIYELGMKFAQGGSQDEIVEFVLTETNRIVRADAGVIYMWL